MEIYILLISAVFILQIWGFSVTAGNSDVGLNTRQMIEKNGYKQEIHHVTTEDGYILTVYRIPNGIKQNDGNKRPPVFLMHGLLSSSADYVNMGPKRSLGYILADMGYDVWLGNARGNTESQNHTKLSRDKEPEAFFDFSWHEIGYYDLAAMIDYVLKINGDSSLHYVGHSQGGTNFLVLTSSRPEYNKKIKIASLMAPASFMEHRSGTSITDILAQNIEQVQALAKKYNLFELNLENIRKWGAENCEHEENFGVCKTILYAIGGGPNDAQLDTSMLSVISTNAPNNAAIKQFIHFGQLIKNGGFKSFDYGPEENMKKYKSAKPPLYDLSKITAPVAVYYGKNDDAVNPNDALGLISRLPNVVEAYLVHDDLFNHIDFIFAKDVNSLLYNHMTAIMQKYK